MLSDHFDARNNSLNAIRLVLALLVIVSHAPPVMGLGEPYQWADLDVGGWAVAGFFAISGWLITTSRLHLDLAAFMWRRVLRIMPAFWVSLVVVAAVFAPLAALGGGPAPDPVSSAGYVVRNAALWIGQPTISGSLTSAYEPAWNLSLWTLFWEMCCYLGVGLVMLVPVVRRRRLPMGLLAVVAIVADLVVRTTEVVDPGSPLGAGLRLGSFFLAGAALRMWADRVPLRHGLALACGAAIAVLWPLGLVGALGQLPVAYLCLYAAIHLPLTSVGARNDISYGVYIYGFPVGHLLVVAGAGDLPVPAFIALNMLAVVPLAAASWFLLERRAMAWKSWVPSGGAPSADRVPST